MASSVAPTPVMPKTATAVSRPPSGRWNDRPSTTLAQEKYSGREPNRKAELTVSAVKLTTNPTDTFSTSS